MSAWRNRADCKSRRHSLHRHRSPQKENFLPRATTPTLVRRKRPGLTVFEKPDWSMKMSFVDTFKCVHGAKRGHTRTRTNCEGAEEEATASQHQRAARDRGRDVDSRCVGVSRCQTARCECQPSLSTGESFIVKGSWAARKQLLAVEVTQDRSALVTEEASAPSSGTIEIKLAKGSLRIFGSIDASALRVVLECLAG